MGEEYSILNKLKQAYQVLQLRVAIKVILVKLHWLVI